MCEKSTERNPSRMLGIPLRSVGAEPIRGKPGDPGFGWKLSPQALADIEEINRHVHWG